MSLSSSEERGEDFDSSSSSRDDSSPPPILVGILVLLLLLYIGARFVFYQAVEYEGLTSSASVGDSGSSLINNEVGSGGGERQSIPVPPRWIGMMEGVFNGENTVAEAFEQWFKGGNGGEVLSKEGKASFNEF